MVEDSTTSRCYEQLNFIKHVLVVSESVQRQVGGLNGCWKPFIDLFLLIFHEYKFQDMFDLLNRSKIKFQINEYGKRRYYPLNI